MSTRLTHISRLLIAVSSALLIVVIFVPIWRIELTAPQYPEGLVLQIGASALLGDVEVINGLNHYIGMQTLHANDFPEFTILPYIFVFFAAVGLLTLMVNRKKLLYSWCILLAVFGVAAMVDFYRWNYNYGHNLNPEAPIRVPGMSYQPPLIGYKQLLNFGAYSIPDIGGWLLVLVYVLLSVALVYEIRTIRITKSAASPAFALPVLMILLHSCSSSPKPIRVGTDGCDFCKMTVTDERFAAELVTEKGKTFIFDDLHCLKQYLADNPDKSAKASFFVVDYSSKKLVDASTATLVKGEQFHSPMGSNTVAFQNKAAAKEAQATAGNQPVPWSSIVNQ